MSDSVQPHRRQPTRLPHPWDPPGKNIGVGCHFLLQCMKVKSESEVTHLCLTLRDPMDCSLPGSCVHGIFQARVGCHCLLQFTIWLKRFYYYVVHMPSHVRFFMTPWTAASQASPFLTSPRVYPSSCPCSTTHIWKTHKKIIQ